MIDFTDKADEQVKKIIRETEGKETCGRIYTKPLPIMTAGIILVTHLSLVWYKPRLKVSPKFLQKQYHPI